MTLEAYRHPILNKWTGEEIAADDIDANVAYQAQLDEAREWVEADRRATRQNILAYADLNAQWTIEAGGYKVTIPSPEAGKETQWVLSVLSQLQEHIPSERFVQLVPRVERAAGFKLNAAQQVYVPDTRSLDSAAKAGGDVGRIINDARVRIDKGRYPKLSR